MLEYDNGPGKNINAAKDGSICQLIRYPNTTNLLFLKAIKSIARLYVLGSGAKVI
jgi:hypothetical protein